MGQTLAEFYKQAEKLGGLKAQMRMAIITLLPSAKAAAVPDSPDLIAKFERALTEIRKEFK
jgi:hypothetical protein